MKNLPNDLLYLIFEYANKKDFYEITSMNKEFFNYRECTIQVFELNKKRQKFPLMEVENKPFYFIIYFHKNDNRCLLKDPELSFTRQKNVNRMYKLIKKNSNCITKIIYKGLSCNYCSINFVKIEK